MSLAEFKNMAEFGRQFFYKIMTITGPKTCSLRTPVMTLKAKEPSIFIGGFGISLRKSHDKIFQVLCSKAACFKTSFLLMQVHTTSCVSLGWEVSKILMRHEVCRESFIKFRKFHKPPTFLI